MALGDEFEIVGVGCCFGLNIDVEVQCVDESVNVLLGSDHYKLMK